MPIETTAPRTTFKLRSFFAVILLVVLLLPLSGGYFFRIYENELVRQTETELIAQGVFISAMYKQALQADTQHDANFGNEILNPAAPLDEKYTPIPPSLDLRTATIHPTRPDAIAPNAPASATALSVAATITPVIEDARMSTLAGIRILDPNGVVIVGKNDMGLSLADIDEVRPALQGHYTSVLRQRISDEPRPPIASLSRGTDVRVFIAMPIIQDNRVVGVAYLSRSPRNILNALYEERKSVFLAGLSILLMTTAIALLLSAAIGRPLNALTRHAQLLAAGERPLRKLPSPPISEIASLTQSFDVMSETIAARSAYIKSFAMHLAHEFKTPLTAIQGAIELLNDHPHDMTAAERAHFLSNITHDTDRLKKLVTRLLELARADVMQAQSETTNIAPLINNIAASYSGKVQVDMPQGTLNANIGADILETALVNLIDNSLQHGATHVLLRVTPQVGKIELCVTDNGPGISAGNAARLFTPFFTTKRENGGTGLGLVITQSLLRSYDGEVFYTPTASGAQFTVVLKSFA